MEKFLQVIACIAFAVFIAYQVFEAVLAHRYYKRMEREHKKFIDALVDEVVEDMFREKKKKSERKKRTNSKAAEEKKKK